MDDASVGRRPSAGGGDSLNSTPAPTWATFRARQHKCLCSTFGCKLFRLRRTMHKPGAKNCCLISWGETFGRARRAEEVSRVYGLMLDKTRARKYGN